MKKFLLLLLIAPFSVQSQVITFFTEDFGIGCNEGQYATDYFSFTSGTWNLTLTGDNYDGTSNSWFVSAMENGEGVGQCGTTGCGDNPTLHIGADNSPLGSDLEASYFEGLDILCELFGCGATDKRIESSAINCSAFSNIVLDFVYMEGGNAIDNATLWYFDGSTWSQLDDPDKTAACGGTEGEWAAYSIPLPASANGNANVKLGFRWVNNDDADATDPSFAVDDITLTGDFGEDFMPPEVICPPDDMIMTDEFCGVLGDYTDDAIVTDDIDPFPTIVQTPEIGSEITGTVLVTITATDNSGNSSECIFQVTVMDDDAPEITCIPSVSLTVQSGETGDDVILAIPDASDNCGNVSITNDFNGSDDASGFYPVGTTSVVYTAMDDSGNTAECTTLVNITVQPADCCLGDFNCDGFISVLDLLIIVTDFSCLNSCTADLNGDGIVTVPDMQIFTGLFGTFCP